jgi:hypothetical protein
MASRKSSIFAAVSAVTATTLMATFAAWSQSARPPISMLAPPPPPPNERQVYLVRLDQSDCTNSNVPNTDGPNVGGNIWLSRDSSGNTNIKVAITASPSTSYNIYLKCVRQIGTITTDDEGSAIATFTYPTSSVGATYAFDMYPNGAPAGNKFQSATVNY